MRHSIEYLNARRETATRKGKTIFAKASAKVDSKAQFAELDRWERALTEADAIMTEFRSWADNSRAPVAMLAAGESLDDLSF